MNPEIPDLKLGRQPHGSHRRSERLHLLEWITLGHVGIFLIATTWAFGGQADWVRAPLAMWGTAGLAITFLGIRDHLNHRDPSIRMLYWTIPVLLFNALVLLACLNPSLRPVYIDGDLLYVPDAGRPDWPSAALPDAALQALWIFDAIWVSCFNVAFVLRRRRAIRGLLLVVALNALILAIFGTVQRLAHATGLYFGAFPTRQIHFFASFVYHNHWGAFMLLVISTSIGLVWHYARRAESRDFFHSPAFGGIVAVALMAATIPLSASRSTSILAIVLLGLAFLHWVARMVRQRRRYSESVAPPLVAAAAALLLGCAGIAYLARGTIATRVALTREQVDAMLAQGNVGARGTLYHNTLRMAEAKPWFGWGMASYPSVFTLFNTQRSVDRLPVFYNDAHSDWLQSFAEHGVVGSFALALCALVPLAGLRRGQLKNPMVMYPLAGCGIVLLYAWLEFPFGNFAVVLTWWLCFFGAVRYAMLRAAATLPPA